MHGFNIEFAHSDNSVGNLNNSIMLAKIPIVYAILKEKVELIDGCEGRKEGRKAGKCCLEEVNCSLADIKIDDFPASRKTGIAKTMIEACVLLSRLPCSGHLSGNGII